MKKFELLAASAFAMIAALPAAAQTAPDAAPQESAAQDSGYGADIVVTAQRQSQTLQEVPIAVSAFSAETLQAQQIENASDLQLTLPNVNFSKGNFTGSSFTIRGIGDLCVGISCDSATAIHINGSPLLGTRLFETEYFDLERIEVLRGPQGTLFGRNATSGVVNVIAAKPNLDKFEASAEGEYANFDSYKARAMINIPLGETLAVRAAGFYLKRDGYTLNRFNGDQIDGRDMYAVRGSIRWEPSVDTTVDLMGYYFRENDNRLRIQKQQCQRDATGVLGCLNNRRDSARTNTNSTFTGTLGSSEFLSARGIPASFGLNSLYGPDGYSGFADPTDVREVNTAFTPEYFADELQIQGRIEHNFGPIKAQLTGLYSEASVDSRQDYNLGVANRAGLVGGLGTLAFFAANGIPTQLPAPFPPFVPGSQAYFAPLASAIIPGGPAGQLCTSDTTPNGLGAFGGNKVCSNVPLAFDRSNQKNKSWSAEGILSSDFDGAFNFLLGGIYVDGSVRNGDYYVNAFSIDYVVGVLGSFGSFGAGLPPSFLGTPFFRNNTELFTLKSYGLFGEGYLDISDNLKVTVGVRYNNDKKFVRARSTLASFLVPYNQTGDAFDSPFSGGYDADLFPNFPGIQEYQLRQDTFDALTGRAVIDYKITDDNLIYASYSRGYKSGGFNPPTQVPNLPIPDGFGKEKIDSFEIGSKNVFANGALTLNLTAFYYKYKGLQLSRIVARSSVNDNIDADIWGVEAESIVRPGPGWAINLGASYLNTEVKSANPLVNQRDPGGGRADAVIIKDITNGSNCAVVPTVAGNAVGSNAFVNFVNSQINASVVTDAGLVQRTAANPNGAPLRGTTAFAPDSNIASTGAFSICAVLAGFAGPAGAAFGGIQVATDGVAVSIKGNELPQAPVFKASVGVQKTFEFGNGMSFVPRADLTYTGESFGNIFNGRINKVEGYEQLNAQIQLNGADQRWFVRGFIQNILDNNATTGLYLTDQSSGLFTNIFTLDPRRYGVAAGFKF